MTKEEVLSLNLTKEQKERVEAVYNAFDKFHDAQGKKKGGKNAGRQEKPIFEELKTEKEVKKYIDELIKNYSKRKSTKEVVKKLTKEEREAIINSANDFLNDYKEFNVTGGEILARFAIALKSYSSEFMQEVIDKKQKELDELKEKFGMQ